MNYQSVEKLQKKFKIENGWEVIEDGYEINIYNQYWKVEIECWSRYDDGDGYPYINLYFLLGEEGYPKYVSSFVKLQDCINKIKTCGVV